MNELDVVGVRVEMPSNQPIVLLKESGGERYLPIWIGAGEATAIAFAQQGVVPPRPLTPQRFRPKLAVPSVSYSRSPTWSPRATPRLPSSMRPAITTATCAASHCRRPSARSIAQTLAQCR